MRRQPLCLAALATALASAASPSALANSRVGPPAGDIFSAWIGARFADNPDKDNLVADEAVTHDMVLAPRTPYSVLRSVPMGFRGSVWTRAFANLQSSNTPMNRAAATEALAWDLGMTNGYPGVVDADYPVPDLGARWAGTQLAKAGVSEALARKALALTGQAAYTVAANYAVAAQILFEKLACYGEEEWAAYGLRKDVLDRFQAASSLSKLSDFDLVYLVRLLEGELSTWTAGETTIMGRRQLPTALRVARVAAAFRDMQGYKDDPCTSAGRYRPSVATTDPAELTKPMCLVDASDRAVLQRYLLQFDRQTDPTLTNFTVAPASRMSRLVRPMRPFWLGIFGKELQKYSANLEVTESLVAYHVAFDTASDVKARRYAHRRALFLCGKEGTP
jgi:hypothetical protein